MALRLIEGFDDDLMFMKGWQPSTYSANYAAGRFGGSARAYRGYPAGNETYRFVQPLTGTVIVGFALSSVDRGAILFNFDSLGFGVDTAGCAQLYSGSTLKATSPSSYWVTSATWRYVELKYELATGNTEVRIDGVFAVSGTIATATSLSTMYLAPKRSLATFDDMYVLDNSGTTNNDFLGDVRVQTSYPIADGSHTDMVPSTGTDHFAVVDEVVPDTTSYVSSSTAGAKDSYKIQPLPSNTAQVFGLNVSAYASKDATGAAGIVNTASVNGTDYTGSNVGSLSTTWTTTSELWEVNPATGQLWSPNDISSSEFGVEIS